MRVMSIMISEKMLSFSGPLSQISHLYSHEFAAYQTVFQITRLTKEEFMKELYFHRTYFDEKFAGKVIGEEDLDWELMGKNAKVYKKLQKLEVNSRKIK